jgi:hypothetical protein
MPVSAMATLTQPPAACARCGSGELHGIREEVQHNLLEQAVVGGQTDALRCGRA